MSALEKAREGVHDMSKFTPGPWAVQGSYSADEAGLAVLAVHDDVPAGGTPTRGMVAWSSQLLPELAAECEANALLISAAPDMYAALWLALNTLHKLSECEADERETASCLETIQNLLTKIDGE